MIRGSLFAALLATLVLAPEAARAHRLDAAAWLDPDGIRIVVTYAEGRPAAGATVLVFVRGEGDGGDDNFRGPPLFQDKLDREGKLLFKPGSPRDFLCVIDDGAGHRAELRIRDDDLQVLFDSSKDAGGLSPAASSRPIAVSDRPITLNDVPLPIRIAAGILTIALATLLVSWILRFRRRHAP